MFVPYEPCLLSPTYRGSKENVHCGPSLLSTAYREACVSTVDPVCCSPFIGEACVSTVDPVYYCPPPIGEACVSTMNPVYCSVPIGK